MRFSAWSSLAISVCSTLALAPAAYAHLSVSPAQVKPGQAVDLVFGAPNEDDAFGISRVTLRPPAGFDLDDAEAKPGWTQARSADAITWSGGNIPKGQYATFGIRGTAPDKTGTIVFNVRVGDAAGRGLTYRVGLDVVGSGHDVATPALIVALAAAVLALIAFFVGLYVWLRPQR
ncbi:MAG TPA: hypothetical protein VI408_09395 [Gaiellaceae bacterium]